MRSAASWPISRPKSAPVPKPFDGRCRPWPSSTWRWPRRATPRNCEPRSRSCWRSPRSRAGRIRGRRCACVRRATRCSIRRAPSRSIWCSTPRPSPSSSPEPTPAARRRRPGRPPCPVVHIPEAAGPQSLVLLDELGAGTDPEEGSALARAILATLVEMQVTTLVATHYAELKAFAHNTPGVRNASVEFDLASLRPTYHLSIGLPGRSNALAIADRLGLPRPIMERARERVGPQALRAEGLLDEIHRQREEARQARREAEAARLQAEAQRAELRRRLEGIEVERAAILEGARREAADEAQAVLEEADELRRRLARAGKPLEEAKAASHAARELAQASAEPILPIRPSDQTPPGGGGGPPAGPARPGARPRVVREKGGWGEIDVGGLPVDEALEVLEQRLDSAY